jgi:hypothetical protein
MMFKKTFIQMVFYFQKEINVIMYIIEFFNNFFNNFIWTKS